MSNMLLSSRRDYILAGELHDKDLLLFLAFFWPLFWSKHLILLFLIIPRFFCFVLFFKYTALLLKKIPAQYWKIIFLCQPAINPSFTYVGLKLKRCVLLVFSNKKGENFWFNFQFHESSSLREISSERMWTDQMNRKPNAFIWPIFKVKSLSKF